MDTIENRIAFAKALRETLAKTTPRENLHRLFMERLSQINEDFSYPSRITDESLNAAWNFCDYYFDALGHKFDDCGGIPMDRAATKLNEVAAALEKGDKVKDPDVLRFFHKPKEWRLQKQFPWVSRG